jgi:hypothetical protein
METSICGICDRPVNTHNDWTWSEDVVHGECALNCAEWYCKKCDYFVGDEGEELHCHECGGTDLIKVTDEMRKQYLKEHPDKPSKP